MVRLRMGYYDETPRLVGGRLCIDFVNTADWDGPALHAEKLREGADAAAFAVAVDIASKPQAVSAAELEELRALRADLRGMLCAIAAGTKPVKARQDRVNALFAATPLRLADAADGPRLEAAGGLAAQIAARVALSAFELLGSRHDRARLKVCPGPCCGWLFLDESRNGTRRWCMMETCGNRAKARTHYRRHRRGRQDGLAGAGSSPPSSSGSPRPGMT